MRHVRALFVLFLAAAWACNGGEDVSVGMAQSEVRRKLGEPSRQVTDPEHVKLYLGRRSECPSGTVVVWIYKRLLRDDLVLGFDNASFVSCVRKSKTFDLRAQADDGRAATL